jgi:OOP family OmpA-OmpF porin
MKKWIFGFYCLFWLPALAQEHEIIRSIYFGGGSYYINQTQKETINRFLDSLPHLENYQISINSHTDNIGGAAYNQWLSQMRSEAVLYQLTSQQIQREKVLIKNDGQYNPYFDNNTNIGRESNRRVDIIFTPPVF